MERPIISTQSTNSAEGHATADTTSPLVVLNDPPCEGAVNMARDEALLTMVGRGDQPPTLRLYEWAQPTISLGYFQPYAHYQALPPPAGDLPVVRRLTGGGAILHDRELTYSVTVPVDHPLVARDPNRLYEVVHRAVIQCLDQLGLTPGICGQTDDSTPARGPFFCFERRHRFDVLLGAGKVAGSAQRRGRQAILQHGSIILDRRYDQQPSAMIGDCGGAATLRRELPSRLAATMGVRWIAGQWSDATLQFADELAVKYASDAWTRRR